jgi:hypothetical protein
MVVAQAAVKLLPRICSRYATRDDQQYAVIQTSGLAADTCSILLKTGNVEKALEQLELGRGLILSYTIDDRSDLSVLQSVNESLAQRYKALRIQASMPIDSREAVDRERLLKERREAVNAIEACIDEIRRTVPGQERFLLGPTIEEIKMHAIEGPIVIINVTDIASDAIIVSHNQVKSLPLPGLSPDTAPHHIQYQFRQYLSNRRGDYHDRDIGGDDSDSDSDDVEADQLTWLWSNCVKLVLDELATMGLASADEGDPPSRVWWMGSGIASSFPFHAAGIASDGALNRTVSSYTPTIKALGYSRAKAATTAVNAKAGDDIDNENDNNINSKSTILVVTMSTTPGHKPLKGARREYSVIEAAAVGSSTTNTASSPYSICTVQELPQPSVRSVLA